MLLFLLQVQRYCLFELLEIFLLDPVPERSLNLLILPFLEPFLELAPPIFIELLLGLRKLLLLLFRMLL